MDKVASISELLFDAEYYRMLGYSINERAEMLANRGYVVEKEELSDAK